MNWNILENTTRGPIYEHRLEAEEDLGRFLKPNEIVHHHYLPDGSYYLAVCQNYKEHKEMHICEEAFRYSGHWDWRKCTFCKQYDDPKNLSISSWGVCHKSCKAKNTAEWHKSKMWLKNTKKLLLQNRENSNDRI